jgi:hypothetical protein
MRISTPVSLLLSVAIIVFSLHPAAAQERKISRNAVPKAILTAFERDYPAARVTGYTTETEDGKASYEVESYRGKMTLDVAYRPDGTVIEVEEGIAPEDMPPAVKNAVDKNYPGGKIVRLEKRTVGETVTYELTLASGRARVSLEIDPAGKILHESTHKARR